MWAGRSPYSSDGIRQAIHELNSATAVAILPMLVSQFGHHGNMMIGRLCVDNSTVSDVVTFEQDGTISQVAETETIGSNVTFDINANVVATLEVADASGADKIQSRDLIIAELVLELQAAYDAASAWANGTMEAEQAIRTVYDAINPAEEADDTDGDDEGDLGTLGRDNLDFGNA
jgi:hypothetical protein